MNQPNFLSGLFCGTGEHQHGLAIRCDRVPGRPAQQCRYCPSKTVRGFPWVNIGVFSIGTTIIRSRRGRTVHVHQGTQTGSVPPSGEICHLPSPLGKAVTNTSQRPASSDT